MPTARPFEKQVCKCNRCGHEWLSESAISCPKCRSPYWNKDRVKKMPEKVIKKTRKIYKSPNSESEYSYTNIAKPEPTILDDKAQIVAALQCAITQKFNCGYRTNGVPATVLCKACFKAPFWNDKVTIENLLTAFNVKQEKTTEEPEPEDNPENLIENPEIVEKIIDEEYEDVEEIQGRESISEEEKQNMKKKCYLCREKFKSDNGKWNCNFMDFKAAAPHDYCKLCWELTEIWKERAVGQK